MLTQTWLGKQRNYQNMTNQVENVTENQNTELSVDEEFDLEWEKDEESDQLSADDNSSSESSEADSDDSADHGKAEDNGPETDGTVDDESSSDTSGDDSESDSGQTDEDDIWAGASEAQRQAFEKSQNDLNSMTGRARKEREDRLALERDFENTQRELREHTRTKGAYETEHPELFNEVKTYLEESGYQKQSAEPQDDTGSEEPDDDVKLVMKIHPDASDLMQSDAWSDFVGDLSAENQKLLESDDPYDFVDLMYSFKTDQKIKEIQASQQQQEQEEEDDSVVHQGGSSTSAPRKTTLTVEEDFDQEWNKDD